MRFNFEETRPASENSNIETEWVFRMDPDVGLKILKKKFMIILTNYLYHFLFFNKKVHFFYSKLILEVISLKKESVSGEIERVNVKTLGVTSI